MSETTRVGRMRDVLSLAVRHLRPEMLSSAGLEPGLQPEFPEGGDPERFARDLEDLGPTFVKLGQLLSTRPDLLPEPYLVALRRLQDDVAPVPVAEVRAVIELELGHRVDDAFDWFDDEPLASASLAQVHRARLANGHEVVVKVQRPDIADTIRADVQALATLTSVVDSTTDVGRRFAFGAFLTSFRSSLVAELDFRNESDNLVAFAGFLEGYEHLAVPCPVGELTTRRVLTMDWIDGRKVTDLGNLARLDIEGADTARELLRAYLDQMLVHGLLHADPHPGNMLWCDGRLVLLDLGMVARLSHRIRAHLLDMVLALGEGRADQVTEVVRRLGTPLEDFDPNLLERSVTDIVGRFQASTSSRLDAGTVLLEITRASSEAGLRPPAELSMVGKALLNLDETVSRLAPDLRPHEEIRDHVASLVRHEVEQGLSPARAARTAIATARMAEELPDQVHRILGDLVQGDLRFRIDAFDQEEMLRGFEKVATRLTAGIILAGMVVGTALAMRIESDVTILGMPALATVFFVLAAVTGLGLAVNVVVGDWWDRHRRRI